MCGPAGRLNRGLALLVTATLLGAGACSPPDPGQVRLRVISTPPPDDKFLSPLLDPRLTSFELRGRDDQGHDVLLGRTRFDREELPSREFDGSRTLSLGLLPVGGRDLQLLALGAAGQQVLGLAVARDVTVRYGETQEYVFDMRRPLFFFGSGRKLVPPMPFPPGDQDLSPGRRIAAGLRQEHLLRVVDPNAGLPLLTSYHLALAGLKQAMASGATSDGRSLLVATEGGMLHLVETLHLRPALAVKLPTDMSARFLTVSPRDDSAAVLHYEMPTPAEGIVGRITLLRDLPGLRSRVSKDGDLLVVEVHAEPGVPPGPPLYAAYAPDGLLDVIFGRPPLLGGEPDCNQLGGADKSVLRRYDPRSGQVRYQTAIAYSTAVTYNDLGEQLLVQPCVQAPNAQRKGQVLFQQWQGEGFARRRALPAPGTADIAVVAGRQVLVAVGRDDTEEAPDDVTKAQGMVRVLEPRLSDWSLQSPFPLPDWLLPYRVTVVREGGPTLPASVEIVLAPRDLLVYRIVATPDRSRALVTARVTHRVKDMFLNRYMLNNREYICYIDWFGYTYHVLLVNLQTGAEEHDWMVGVQNHSCDSKLFDKMARQVVSTCFAECRYTEGGMLKKGRLLEYQEGFLPAGLGALFSGQ